VNALRLILDKLGDVAGFNYNKWLDSRLEAPRPPLHRPRPLRKERPMSSRGVSWQLELLWSAHLDLDEAAAPGQE
jgi:hypothetical protein